MRSYDMIVISAAQSEMVNTINDECLNRFDMFARHVHAKRFPMGFSRSACDTWRNGEVRGIHKSTVLCPLENPLRYIHFLLFFGAILMKNHENPGLDQKQSALGQKWVLREQRYQCAKHHIC